MLKAWFRTSIHLIRTVSRVADLHSFHPDPDPVPAFSADTDPDTDQIQSGSRALMTKNSQKITAAKKNFFYQNLYLPIPRPPGNGINTIRIRDKHPGSATLNLLLLCRSSFCPPGSGSGFRIY